MICILHGWLLEGSGSNLWTRSMITALSRIGETIHLVCQENHPDLYDAIGEAYRYDEDGGRVCTLMRDTPYPGRCVLHQPWIGDTLPVFVWDQYEEYSNVVPMIELPDEVLEAYIERNVAVVRTLVDEHEITAIHANHAVLMSVVAQRVSRDRAIPYTIMPHGSGIEYAVKKDQRFAEYASSAFADCNRIFVIGGEMRRRVKEVFESVPNLNARCVELHLGVDTSQFDPVARHDRPGNIRLLGNSLVGTERGRTGGQTRAMVDALSDSLPIDELSAILGQAAQYDAKSPDADVEQKLDAVDWIDDTTLLFTGRLISIKGPQAVVAALPLLLEQNPELKLIMVGHGPLREPLEAMIWGLGNGNRQLVETIIAAGKALEGDPEGDGGPEQLQNVMDFYAGLESRGELDKYFETARKFIKPDSVIFTGYLTHKELRFLFPCCDVGVFPSFVLEAGPLVFLEALASGCFPLGTYFGGMAASIDAAERAVPAEVAEIMKLDPENAVQAIVEKVPRALRVGVTQKDALSRLARDKYDWGSVAIAFRDELRSLTDHAIP